MAREARPEPGAPEPSPRPRPFRLLAVSRLTTVAAGGAVTAAPHAAGAAAPATRAARVAPADPAAWTAPAGRWFAALAAAGVDALQLREKQLDDRALHALALQARAALPAPARLLVNGRADVALAAGADGVHLPADGVPAGALRARFGGALLIGVSTHHPDEVVAARRAGADYVVFGPVYATPGKAAFGAPAGPAGLARAAAHDIPVYALGGVTLDRFPEVAAAGAAGVAGIRLFQRLDGLERVVDAARACFS